MKKKKEVDTRGLFLNILTKIGCPYTIDKEDNDAILFDFQGERFYAWTHGNSYNISIWNYCWMSRKLSDFEHIAKLKELVNKANENFKVTTVYSVDEDYGDFDLDCCAMMPLMPQMPYIEDYLKIELHQFFRVHRFIEIEEERLKSPYHVS